MNTTARQSPLVELANELTGGDRPGRICSAEADILRAAAAVIEAAKHLQTDDAHDWATFDARIAAYDSAVAEWDSHRE